MVSLKHYRATLMKKQFSRQVTEYLDKTCKTFPQDHRKSKIYQFQSLLLLKFSILYLSIAQWAAELSAFDYVESVLKGIGNERNTQCW